MDKIEAERKMGAAWEETACHPEKAREKPLRIRLNAEERRLTCPRRAGSSA